MFSDRSQHSRSRRCILLLWLVVVVLFGLLDSVNAADDDNNGDDAVADDVVEDDFYAADDDDGNQIDDAYQQEQNDYQVVDDDGFHWDENVGFEGVSVMPLSCINYNNGHMIKFQMFDTANSYQCHFAEISTFVVSISHYMRAYFNYQALKYGEDFQLPGDAGYLNCVPLSVDSVYSSPLYAKVGCMERETFTSTKLQLHVYTDQQCSQPFDDGQSARKHATKGYDLGGVWLSSKISFRPDFYSCLTCVPEQISQTFSKVNSNWYDDDYISKYGGKQGNDDEGEEAQGDDDAADDAAGDDQAVDDQYYAANDDYNNYNADDDNNRVRRLVSAKDAAGKSLQAYQDVFWGEYNKIQRKLYDYQNYDIGDWNMCQRVYTYGMWCDDECRSLDFFRTDLWSASDIFLLAIMCTFLTAMLLLIVAKRLKAQQKARMYGEDHSMPGLPPCAMAIIFLVIMSVIVAMAELKFINETLVFAVVTCILLFIYMLKLTLFENRRPVLLAAPRHGDMFDNPLDDKLFD